MGAPAQRTIPTPLSRALPLIGAAAIVLGVILLLRSITPHIDFNDGYGYDGVAYADMVRAFRGQSDGALLAERPHYAYRPLPAMLVAASGLNIKIGFLAMNLAAFIASGPILLLLLRAYGSPTSASLLAVFWWAVLPAAVRYAIYYPVLIDGIGLLFMLAILAAAAWRRVALFAVLLAFGVLARENLVILVPFLWFRLLPLGIRRASVLTLLAALPGAMAFEAVRLAPPIPSPQAFSVLVEFRQNFEWLLQNATDRAWRFVAAGPTTLGLLFVIPLVRPRSSVRFLRAQPEWAYYLISTLALIVVGGGDFDRYFLFFVPALALLTFTAAAPMWSSVARSVVLTTIQLIAVRFGWPVGPSEEQYLTYTVATMTLARLRDVVWLAAAGALAAALAIARPWRRFASHDGGGKSA